MSLVHRQDGAAPEGAPRSPLHCAVWRWHFYAGLICLPFLFVMAVTGGLYLFRTEIEEVLYGDVLQVQPRGTERLPASVIVAQALSAIPGAATRYAPPAAANRSAEVGIATTDGRRVTAYVDPYSGIYLGAVDDDTRPMDVVKQIHSLAIAGTVANHWIEIVAGWAIVLVITGTYLWWPRGRRGGVVSLRQTPASRIWWRDLHAVSGAFAGAIVLFLAVTGMPWSAFWGEQFNRLMTRFDLGLPAYVWGQAPQSELPMSSQGVVPWTIELANVPMSYGTSAGGPVGIDAAVAAFERAGLSPGYRVTLPTDPLGVYSALLFPDDATEERVIHLDQYSGQPLIDISYRDYGIAGKAAEWGIAVHQGKQYGLPNQLLMLAGCLAIIVLAISAVVMWWRRRPRGQLSAPPRREGDRVARNVVAIAIGLGLLFPLLGASMLVALLADALWPRRWRNRFGL